jgi:hypothetical protein
LRSLLNQYDFPGVSAEELELFKNQFGTSAFTCRLRSCPRATLGFDSERLRLEHEMAHVRRLRCTFPACQYPPFVSAQALKNHVTKHHNPNPARKSIRRVGYVATKRLGKTDGFETQPGNRLPPISSFDPLMVLPNSNVSRPPSPIRRNFRDGTPWYPDIPRKSY